MNPKNDARAVGGEPATTKRITPNGSSPAASPILAAPAIEQGEREAFEDAVKQTPAFAQVSHMLARRDFPGALRPGTYVNEAVEFAWGLWQARASLSASTPSAEARDAARLDWLGRQDLDDLAFGLVKDAPHDGEYVINAGDGPYYGKTLRAAIDAAMNTPPAIRNVTLGEDRMLHSAIRRSSKLVAEGKLVAPPADNKENGNGR